MPAGLGAGGQAAWSCHRPSSRCHVGSGGLSRDHRCLRVWVSRHPDFPSKDPGLQEAEWDPPGRGPSPRAGEAGTGQELGEGLAELRPRPGPWATGTRVQALPAADQSLLTPPKRGGRGIYGHSPARAGKCVTLTAAPGVGLPHRPGRSGPRGRPGPGGRPGPLCCPGSASCPRGSRSPRRVAGSPALPARACPPSGVRPRGTDVSSTQSPPTRKRITGRGRRWGCRRRGPRGGRPSAPRATREPAVLASPGRPERVPAEQGAQPGLRGNGTRPRNIPEGWCVAPPGSLSCGDPAWPGGGRGGVRSPVPSEAATSPTRAVCHPRGSGCVWGSHQPDPAAAPRRGRSRGGRAAAPAPRPEQRQESRRGPRVLTPSLRNPAIDVLKNDISI